MSELSSYERLGGEEVLRAIIGDFVDRVTGDMMIGFFFRQIEKGRLKELEAQFAAAHLGGPKAYSGRPLHVAHKSHPIMGGHFNRRMVLLEKTLRDHQVPADIQREWLAHNAALRSHITANGLGECNDPWAGRTQTHEIPGDEAHGDEAAGNTAPGNES